jgi:pimeloyl-ACP methyl ester carboxylesterase
MTTLRTGDVELHYEIHGDGPPLLLLHGFFGAGADFVPWLDRFGPARAVLPDLRGHGRSTSLRGSFTHREAADDVLALLDELGLERVRALGLSGGANVLLHLATRVPERLDAMVLVSATTHFPEQARALQRGFTLDHLGAEEVARVRARHVRGEAQIEALVRAARAFADSHDDLAFTPEALGRIRARTLVVYGDRDPLYPVEIAVAMYRAIPAASLWVVPGAGHTPVPEGFFPAVRAFLQPGS